MARKGRVIRPQEREEKALQTARIVGTSVYQKRKDRLRAEGRAVGVKHLHVAFSQVLSDLVKASSILLQDWTDPGSD